MNIEVALKHERAQAPKRGSASASGLDLYALDSGVIAPSVTVVVRTGVAVQLPAGTEGQIRGRSSLSKQGIVCSLGTIDNDYRGELGVTLTNTTNWSFFYEAGDRIGQLVIAPVVLAEPVVVGLLNETERGEAGWGSTGK